LHMDQCERLAKRVLKSLSEPYNILGHTILLGASIGIARAPEHGNTVDDLLKNADIALYSVKTAGRKGYKLFGANGKHNVDTQRELETDLCGALSLNQLELHYQPIINLQTRNVTSCEALLRWRHPKHGIIRPKEFLQHAERTGQIIEIDSWVLEQACRDASHWPDNVKVTVNLSALQFENNNLHRVIRNALASAGINSRRLELEVSESILRRDRERMQRVLRNLRKLGVRITLDEFGKEYSSLTDLRTFAFDKIKIDRTYIKDLLLNDDCAAIVRAVAVLAQALGIGTVAEGVETLDERNSVTRAGCSEVQGYYFSQPVPAGDLPPVFFECQQKLGVAA